MSVAIVVVPLAILLVGLVVLGIIVYQWYKEAEAFEMVQKTEFLEGHKRNLEYIQRLVEKDKKAKD